MLKRNPGLKDRIQFYIDFPDYSTKELVQVFRQFCDQVKLTIDPDAETAVITWITKVGYAKNDDFSNARLVRKLFERTRIKQALRGRDTIILPEDIHAAMRLRIWWIILKAKNKWDFFRIVL